jgi:hypothetical protein
MIWRNLLIALPNTPPRSLDEREPVKAAVSLTMRFIADHPTPRTFGARPPDQVRGSQGEDPLRERELAHSPNSFSALPWAMRARSAAETGSCSRKARAWVID